MKQIQTTVYRLPCAGFAEKDGTFTNSARWLQWKNAALPLPGDCKLDQAIVAQIFLRVRALYAKDGGKFPDPILKLAWSYTDPSNPSLSDVLKEINGKALADLEDPVTKQQIKAGQQLPGFAWLKDDGTTICGNWIYCRLLHRSGKLTARRDPPIPQASACTRIGLSPGRPIAACCTTALPAISAASLSIPLANRCGGTRLPKNGPATTCPISKPDSKPGDHMGPFIMNPEGVGRIFGPLGAFADGPFPDIL